MKKKIALLVLFTLLFSTVCLYAQTRSPARQKQQSLENRIDLLEDALKLMKRERLEATNLYKDAQKALKDLKKQYSELEDAVEELCDSDWDKNVQLPANLVRAIDNVCRAADALDLDN